MTDQITTLRALRAAATPGTWFVCGPPWGDGTSIYNTEDPHAGVLICTSFDVECQAEETLENMELICAAVNALPWLLDEIERLRREYMELKCAVWMCNTVDMMPKGDDEPTHEETLKECKADVMRVSHLEKELAAWKNDK